MLTLISATDRPGSNTKKVANTYKKILDNLHVSYHFLSFEEMNVKARNEEFIQMENTILIPADKFIIISPEYNGSYPGILKLMIDNSDISKCWHHKKVLLTGVAMGRAGNLRGMEHLTGSLLYLKMLVHPNRLPISQVDKLITNGTEITDEATLNTIRLQVEDFIKF
jgi:NAD(P)H-dependent FMN reductase